MTLDESGTDFADNISNCMLWRIFMYASIGMYDFVP